MNIEQETSPFIIDRETEIFVVLDYLPLAADKTTLLPRPDAVLQRRPLSAH